jgi:hypothetical protein
LAERATRTDRHGAPDVCAHDGTNSCADDACNGDPHGHAYTDADCCADGVCDSDRYGHAHSDADAHAHPDANLYIRTRGGDRYPYTNGHPKEPHTDTHSHLCGAHLAGTCRWGGTERHAPLHMAVEWPAAGRESCL